MLRLAGVILASSFPISRHLTTSRSRAGLGKFTVTLGAERRALAPLIQDISNELCATAGMDHFRWQPPIGIRRQTILFSHFSNALSAPLHPHAQLPGGCRFRSRHQ